MKQIVVMLLAWTVGVGFSASASTAETVSNDVMNIVRSGAMGVAPVSTADAPPDSDGDGIPDKPEGEEAGEPADSDGDGIPDKHEDEQGVGEQGGGEQGGGEQGGGEQGGGEQGGGGTSPGSGGSEDSVFLTGAYPYVSVTNTLSGETFESTTSDQNVILAMTNAYVTVSNCVLNKSGDTSSEDNSNFFALNAVVAAKSASTVCIQDSTLNSNAEGANCLFASGSGSTIYAYNCTLSSTASSSRGLDATYEGTVIGSKLNIITKSNHCAALATDRGNGYISATDSTLSTAGQGSPLIYSTGVIEANGVTGTATGAQIAGIEGLSTIRIRNSNLTGSGEHASEPIANGVLIYQSNSGDSTDGTATFEVSDSTLTSAINEGAMFYITHSEAVITVQNTALDFDTDNNYLLKAAGNDGSNGWGTAGANGAEVVFTAIDQTLAGNVTVDGISSLDMYLVNSKYTGTFENDTTYTGDGDGIELFINSNSTWTVTTNCTLKSLTVAEGAKIVDGSGNTVSIVDSTGTRVSGASSLTVTVTTTYSTEDVTAPHAITAFEIDRTAFGAMYGTTESEEGSGTGEGEGAGEGEGGEQGGGEGGGENPPDIPGEGGEGGGEQGGGGQGGTPPGSGGSDDSLILTGAYPYTSETNTLAGQTLASTTSDQNVILAMTNAYVTVSNCVLNKSGDTSSDDNSNFFALNAVVAAKSASTVCIQDSTLNSNAEGANCLFASGSGSTIYAYNCTLSSTASSSRGLDATYEGTVIGSKLTIDTQKDHCAALATDRGNGSISATDSTLSTAGQGSPLIYSTGVIEVNGVTGTSWGAQIAGIEGLSAIRIRNSVLSGSGEKASEPVANGVIIYQSNSGDSTDGTATFEVSDSTLTSAIKEGAMFYITHSEAVITVQNTALDFDTDNNYLLKAAGNDGSNGWGTAGANGAEVVFTAIDQTLAGNVTVDGISSLDMYLVNSKYTGTFENDTTYTGDGDGIELFINSNSTWTVTTNCTLKSLTVAEGAKIVDGSGNTVSIVDSTGTCVTGTSSLTVTVTTYSTEDVTAPHAITDFEIDRTVFEAMYGTSQGGSGGSSGGADDHDGWVYYFKPHPPDNAIVKVLVDGAADYGLPDKDHKYCLDGYWNGSAENGVEVKLLYVTQEGYLFSDGCKSNTWDVTITNNAQEVYPPEDVVAIRTQAKSGATYYLTLKEAIAAGKSRISLNDSVTLMETLTVTNRLTLNLNTNAVTVASALTPAFLFTANATVSNGTINSSVAADAGDSVLLRFANGKSTLSDVRIVGDGCLLYVDDGATVTLTNNCAFTCNTAASVCCSSNGTLVIAGDTRKGDEVVMAAPDGFLWKNGELVSGTLPDAVSAETATDSYETAQSATNAAIAINANKANCIDVPEGVEGTAKATYLTKVEATVTSDNVVIIDLKPRFRNEEQSAIDAAVTNEAVVASLVSTNETATATLTKTTPGLYYWIEGGTDVGAVAQPGESVLSTDGGAIELSKPKLDPTKCRAFFKVAAGLSAPAASNGD